MSLSAADFAFAESQMAALAAAGVKPDDGMSKLTSIPMILAFLFREAKQDGADDEHSLDMSWVVWRSAPLAPQGVGDAATVLGQLGFAALAARLRQVAGRRHLSLKPLV